MGFRPKTCLLILHRENTHNRFHQFHKISKTIVAEHFSRRKIKINTTPSIEHETYSLFGPKDIRCVILPRYIS